MAAAMVEPTGGAVTDKSETKEMLIEDMVRFSRDPHGFVLYAYPWGKGELEKHAGPDEWQTMVLKEITEHLKNSDFEGAWRIFQKAVGSGHGVGKSALVAWLIDWSLSTFEDTRGVLTADTGRQLATKTWPEVVKWHNRCITKLWFVCEATSIYSADPEHKKTWRFDAIPWSKSRPEAFAGLHNQGKRIVLIFDEASGIDDVIWETAEGALTDQDTEIFWFAFGNRTRKTGRFHECWNKFRSWWRPTTVDGRQSRLTNKALMEKWKEVYGELSDFFRVRVCGLEPQSSTNQFIPDAVVEAARGRPLRKDQFDFAAKIITLDNAWGGGDEIIIACRQGLLARILQVFPKNDDDFKIGAALARWEDKEQADGVCLDIGWGTGVYSYGKNLNRNWILVAFGSASANPHYANKRAEMWGAYKDWLAGGGSIPDDPKLVEETKAQEAWPVPTGPNTGRIIMESKEDMKARGVPSPNRGDAIAMTFAHPVMPKPHLPLYGADGNITSRDFDPLGDDRGRRG